MTLEYRDFTEAYDAIVVPGPVKAADTSGAELTQIGEQFFKEVQNSLDLSMRTLSYYFRYSSNMLVPRASNEERRHADDDMRLFRLRGGQVLASALYMREDTHTRLAHFSKYPLQSDTITIIHDLQQLERIEFGSE